MNSIPLKFFNIKAINLSLFNLIFILLFLLLQINLTAQTKRPTSDESNQLYPVNVNGNFGYINKFGKVIIKPQFEDANDFKEGLARIRIAGKYGFINGTGKIVINPVYDLANDFFEGLAKIKIKSVYGFINKTGNIVIKPQFDIVGDFSGGFAYIKVADKFGLINLKGEIIMNPICDEWPYFREGLAKIRVNGKDGFINLKGDIVIKPKFNIAGNFSDGLCLVSDSWNQVSGYGYIDKTGNYVIPPQFGSLSSDFKDGIASVKLNGKYGYISKSGKFVIQPQFNTAFPFFEGLAWVSYSEIDDDIYAVHAKYGCIDRTGKFVINPQNYFWPVGFSEGLASVKLWEAGKLTKYEYINKKGEVVIQPQFDIAGAFHDGWAEVMVDKKWGIINKKGRYIEGKIIGELIRVQVKDNISYMDKTFHWVWNPN